MKKIITLVLALCLVVPALKAQKPLNPYEIKFNIKGIKDSVLYLAIYTFDKQQLADTARKAKDGSYTFKKNRQLSKGMYLLVSQAKAKFLDFIIDEEMKFSATFDTTDVVKSIKFTGSPQNDKFLELVKFMADKTREMADFRRDIKAKGNADSTKLIGAKAREMNTGVEKFRKDFIAKYPTGFVTDFVRLQMEPDITNPPKASNGRPDSLWQYTYYKDHYWDGIPLEDERILHTPLFGSKWQNYFRKIVIQIPDSVNKACDVIIDRTLKSKESFKWCLVDMIVWAENNKVMGFDAVFVHLVDRYFVNNQCDFYTKDQQKKITDRANILRPLLLGKVVPELLTVDTNGVKLCMKYKMDTCKTSECLTKAYMSHKEELDRQLVSLHSIANKGEYTVLLFWDIDCGHCKKEVPVIFEKFKELRKEGIDIQVHAVYTQHEYANWLKTLRDMKLVDPDWQNVVDGIHLQNLKEKFDIFSTPVIYILDKNKNIKYKRISADQLSDVIHNLEKMKKSGK